MKGLWRKDLYILWKNCRINLAFIVIYGGIASFAQNTFMALFPCIIAAMTPVTLLGYDERSHWETYTAALPCTVRELVGVKYLLGVALLLGTALYVLLMNTVAAALKGGVNWAEQGSFLLTSLLVSGVPFAFFTLFAFRYGVEKGRMAYYGVMAGSFAVVGVVTALQEKGVWQPLPGKAWAAPVLLLGVVLLVLASWRLSIRAYGKRHGL